MKRFGSHSGFLALSALMLAFAAPSNGQVPAKTQPAISLADLRSRLFRITDDSLLGRETGSLGAFKASGYVAAEFERLGLKPAGTNGGWFQTVPFWIPTAGGPVTVGSVSLQPGRDFVVVSRFVFAPTASLDVVYGGALNDSTHWIDATSAAGKIVVLDDPVQVAAVAGRQQPPFVIPQQFGRAAAVAVIRLDALSPSVAASFARYIPRADTTLTRGRPILLFVTKRAGEILTGGPVARATVGTAGATVRGDIGLHWAPVAYSARNVVGILPGRDPARSGEYVSVTAHHDHVGICGAPVDHDSLRAFNTIFRPMGADTRTWDETPAAIARVRALTDSLHHAHPARVDSICNGADDDGSGTVAILELAEYFATLPMAARPRRSLLFVSHTAEERGLLGSAWYADHSTVPIDSIVAEIDEDMVGRGTIADLPKGGPRYLEVVGARRLSTEFGDMLEKANSQQKTPFIFNYEFDAPGHPLQYYCRADHYSYAKYGIPAVAFSRGEHQDYHQVTDEAQYIDYPDMLRVVNLVRSAVTLVANAENAPKLNAPKGDPHARCVQ